MHFEDFIEQMNDDQYEAWYGIEATDKQKQVADRIREESTEEEASEAIAEQTSPIEQRSRNRFIQFFRSIFRR